MKICLKKTILISFLILLIALIFFSGCTENQSNLGSTKSNLESEQSNDSQNESNLGTTKSNLESEPSDGDAQNNAGDAESGYKQGTAPENGDENPDYKSSLGCCKPVCLQMTKKDCDDSTGGPWFLGSCDQFKECKISCCKPHCVDITEQECTQRGGTSTGKSCSDDDECKKGCCTPFYELNTKTACEMLGGILEEASACEKQKLQGTLSIELNHDDTCSGCSDNSSENSCVITNGITQRLTANLQPDNPEESGLFPNYGNNIYLKGPGTYSIAGNGRETAITTGTYSCPAPPPAYAFKIPIISTNITEDSVVGSSSGTVKVTVEKVGGKYLFSISSDLSMTGNKIRTFLDSSSRKHCTNETETVNIEETDDDPAIEIEGSLPYQFESTSLKGTTTFKQFPPTQMRTCGKEATGTITWDFSLVE